MAVTYSVTNSVKLPKELGMGPVNWFLSMYLEQFGEHTMHITQAENKALTTMNCPSRREM